MLDGIDGTPLRAGNFPWIAVQVLWIALILLIFRPADSIRTGRIVCLDCF